MYVCAHSSHICTHFTHTFTQTSVPSHAHTHAHTESARTTGYSGPLCFFKKEIKYLFFLNFPRRGIWKAGDAESVVQSPARHRHPALRPAAPLPCPLKPRSPASEMSRMCVRVAFRTGARGVASGRICFPSGLLRRGPFVAEARCSLLGHTHGGFVSNLGFVCKCASLSCVLCASE